MSSIYCYSISKFSMENYNSTLKTKIWEHFSQTNANARYKLAMEIGNGSLVLQISEVSKTNEHFLNLKVFVETDSSGKCFVDPSALRMIIKPPVLALRYTVRDSQNSELVVSKAQFSVPDETKFQEAIELFNQVGISLKDVKSNNFVLNRGSILNSIFSSSNKENHMLESQILHHNMQQHNISAATNTSANDQKLHDTNEKYYEKLIYGNNNQKKTSQNFINDQLSAFPQQFNEDSQYNKNNLSIKAPEMYAKSQVNRNLNFQSSQIYDKSQNFSSKVYSQNYPQATSMESYNNASQKKKEKTYLYQSNDNYGSEHFELPNNNENYLFSASNVIPKLYASNDYSNYSQIFYDSDHLNPTHNKHGLFSNTKEKPNFYFPNAENQLITKKNIEGLVKSVLKKVLPEISKTELNHENTNFDIVSTKQKKKAEESSNKRNNLKNIKKNAAFKKKFKKDSSKDYNKHVLSKNVFLAMDIKRKFEVLKKSSFIEAVFMLQECDSDIQLNLSNMISRYTKHSNKNIYGFFEKPEAKRKNKKYKKAHLLIKKIIKLAKHSNKNHVITKNIITQNQIFNEQSKKQKIQKENTVIVLKKQIIDVYDPVKELEMWNPPNQKDENCKIVGEKRLRKTKPVSYKAIDSLSLSIKRPNLSFPEKQNKMVLPFKSTDNKNLFIEPFKKKSLLEVDDHIQRVNSNLQYSYNQQVSCHEPANLTTETLVPLEKLKTPNDN